MPYIGKEPADIIATAVDTTTGTFSGAVSAASLDADGGVTVDNITIDGTEIDLSSGNLTLDVAGQLVINSDSGQIVLQDDTVNWGNLQNSSGDFVIESLGTDKDIIFKGLDGSSTIEAMRIDMSSGGFVGIGTDSPLHQLQNEGTSYFKDNVFIAGGINKMVSSDSSSNPLIFGINANEKARISSAGDVLIGRTSVLTDFGDGRTSLVLQGTGSQDYATIQIGNNGTASDTQILGLVAFYDGTSNNARVQAQRGNATDSADLLFSTRANGGSLTERMRIDRNGRVGIGTTPTAEPLRVQSDSDTDFDVSSAAFNTALMLKNSTSGASNCVSLGMATESNGEIFLSAVQTSSNANADFVITSRLGGSRIERIRIATNGVITTRGATAQGISAVTDRNYLELGAGYLNICRDDTATADTMTFGKNGSVVGRIQTTGSGTNYVETSDYRLKENVTYDFDATSRLKQLKPCRFNFKLDADTTIDGFLAHEVDSIVPYAITGEKDATNEDGSINPQGIDQSKLVPLLTKALQEQQATIESLTARIAALESA